MTPGAETVTPPATGAACKKKEEVHDSATPTFPRHHHWKRMVQWRKGVSKGAHRYCWLCCLGWRVSLRKTKEILVSWSMASKFFHRPPTWAWTILSTVMSSSEGYRLDIFTFYSIQRSTEAEDEDTELLTDRRHRSHDSDATIFGSLRNGPVTTGRWRHFGLAMTSHLDVDIAAVSRTHVTFAWRVYSVLNLLR